MKSKKFKWIDFGLFSQLPCVGDEIVDFKSPEIRFKSGKIILWETICMYSYNEDGESVYENIPIKSIKLDSVLDSFDINLSNDHIMMFRYSHMLAYYRVNQIKEILM